MTAAELGLLINTAIALGVVALWWRAEKRADRAARSLAYYRANPPIPCLLRVELASPHRLADPEKECIRVLDTKGRPRTLAFTDATLLAAEVHGTRIEAHLKAGTARILP